MSTVRFVTIDREITELGERCPAAFRSATPLPLVQYWLAPDHQPAEGGVAYVGGNRDGLIFYTCLDDKNIWTTARQDQEKLWTLGDTVEFFIKPGDRQDTYWEIHVSPNDLLMDIFIASRQKMRDKLITWDEMIAHQSGSRKRVFCTPANNLWGTQLTVPWAAFGGTGIPAAGTRWQFAVCRYNYAGGPENPELSSTAPLAKLNFHNYEDFNQLEF